MSDNEAQRRLLDELWTVAKEKYPPSVIEEIRGMKTLEQLLGKVENAKQAYQDERTLRRRKAAGHKIQSFCATTSKFLEIYSPIVDIVKSLNTGVGGTGSLAYGVFAVLLKVVANKDDRENLIESSLEKIHMSVTDIQEYRRIYQESQELKTLILHVYRDVFYFALSIWDYYHRSTSHRLFQAIRPPPRHDFQIKTDDVDQAVRRVLSATTKLLHHQVSSLQETQRRQENQNLKDNREAIIDSLIHLRTYSPPNNNPEARLDELRPVWDKKQSKKWQKGKLETLVDDGKFLEWFNHQESSMLVAVGINHHNATWQETSWLSPAVAEFASNMRDTGKRTIYHFTGKSEDPVVTFSVMIQEIVDSDDEFFKSHRQALKNSLKRLNRQSEIESWAKIAGNLLVAWAKHEPGPIFLIIDFSMQWPSGHKEHTVRPELIKRLYDLTRSNEGVVKVLVLAEDWLASKLGDLEVLKKSEITGHIITRLGWRQETRLPFK